MRSRTGAVYCEIDDVTQAVELADLNAGGVFVQTTKSPPADSEVRVLLRVGGEEIRAGGHVVQVVTRERALIEDRRPGFGLLFTMLDDAARTRLRQAIEAANAAVLKARPKRDNAEERALLASLRAELRALANKAPWGVLGVDQSAELAQAKAAFFAASKRYHPHRFSQHQMPEIKQTVTELFIAHKRAYVQMEKAAGKARARTTLEIENTVREAVLEAAQAAAASGDSQPKKTPSVPVRTSVRPTTPTVSQRPPRADDPKSRTVDYEQLVQRALKHLAQSRFAEAEAELKSAIDLDPAAAKARIWLHVSEARRAKASGDVATALQGYLNVLSLDPKHHEALQETRKQPKDAQGKGLLGRFFGSGDK